MHEMITDLQEIIRRDPSRKYNVQHMSAVYGWHNALLPPECRRAALNGRDLEADLYSDVYLMMADCYEKDSGHKAPCDFGVYQNWKMILRAQRKTEYLISAIEIGTRHRREKRDPYKVLEILKKAVEN